jgi:hypothetical protein
MHNNNNNNNNNNNVVVKGEVALYLTKHHVMKTYFGVKVQPHAFLTSTLYGGEWSASSPDRFNPEETTLGLHWISGRVGPRAGLDAVEKKNF